jgi:hypothetical protein
MVSPGGEGFTVLRDATPPALDRPGSESAKSGCLGGLCKCLSKPKKPTGGQQSETVKTRPHLIAEVGINASQPSSPGKQKSNSDNWNTNGAAHGAAADKQSSDSIEHVSASADPISPQTARPEMPHSNGKHSETRAQNGGGSQTGGGASLLSSEPLFPPPSSRSEPRPLPEEPNWEHRADAATSGASPPTRPSRPDRSLHHEHHEAQGAHTGPYTPRVTHLGALGQADEPKVAADRRQPDGGSQHAQHVTSAEKLYEERSEVPLLEKVRNQLRDTTTPPKAGHSTPRRKILDEVPMQEEEEEEDAYLRKVGAGFVHNAAHEWVLSDPIERLVEQEIEAVHHCMLVCHETSDEIGCLLTLRAAPRSAGTSLSQSIPQKKTMPLYATKKTMSHVALLCH